jgi:hypothetical protein
MKILSVPIAESLNLEAGTLDETAAPVTILPPAVSLFDQLLEWLSHRESSGRVRISTSEIGIGATALCLRWGSYLAVLLDERKPLDPSAVSEEISMVSDSEMKRINLEFSANLARLIRMLHEDETGCYRLLHLAYDHLVMPRLALKQRGEILEALRGLTSAAFWNWADPELKARMARARPILVRHPYRVLANSMALSAYRNGPVENLHSGRFTGYSLIHRRAGEGQSRELMRYTSEHLASVLPRFRPWKGNSVDSVPWPENLAGIYVSPWFGARSWSLTETCSHIDVESPLDC